MRSRSSRFLAGLAFCAVLGLYGQKAPAYLRGESRPYGEIIADYRALAQRDARAEFLELGPTDSGRPLSLFLLSGSPLLPEQTLADFARGKTVILVNNAIHAGESCGVDASLLWVEGLLERSLAEDLLIAVLPVYNIGGYLQRRPHTRANQQGPHLQGFRGNARNLDLNRDFIKAQALNTQSFHALFQALKPHILVDTHTSNGADYPYVMTLISTQQDKLAPPLAALLKQELEPFLYREMAAGGYPMTPYVNVFNRPPDQGFGAFLESPRYATGYASLFHCLGFVTEAHMLKPYPERVKATKLFLERLYAFAERQGPRLRQAKLEAQAWEGTQKTFPLAWELDSSRVDSLDFEAYGYLYEASRLGEYQRLRYLPAIKRSLRIPYYPHFRRTHAAAPPRYYVLSQAWHEVVQRLQAQQIEMQPLARDTLMAVQSYYIDAVETGGQPYEGRYYWQELRGHWQPQQRLFYRGDYLIPADQAGLYFLLSVLEPEAVDSYLRWAFFDAVLGQKEYFSPYVFEDKAEELLGAEPQWAEDFAAWQAAHPEAMQSPRAVLQWFYQRSAYYESEHRRYPVARID